MNPVSFLSYHPNNQYYLTTNLNSTDQQINQSTDQLINHDSTSIPPQLFLGFRNSKEDPKNKQRRSKKEEKLFSGKF
jgi:hypothetical protein